MVYNCRVLSRSRRAILIFAGFTALGLFQAVANSLTYLTTSGSANWSPSIKRSLGEWYGWAALTPAILYVARRWPLERGVLLRHGTIHLAAMAATAVLKLFLDRWVRALLFGSGGYLLFSNLAFNVLLYWLVVGAAHGLRYYHSSRERELRASQLEARLAETRMQLLSMQLQPHFLFNTLNAISELVHEDAETADRMIAGLSELLRETLQLGGAPAVTVARELQLLGCYVDIQRARFGSRLQVTIDADASALDAAVPPLLLQTLVENAIRHGLSRRAAAGRVDVAVRRDRDTLRLTVIDDGPGLDERRRDGVGLTNTRARLEALFGGDTTFDLANNAAGGVRVAVRAPYRPLEAAAGADPGGRR